MTAAEVSTQPAAATKVDEAPSARTLPAPGWLRAITIAALLFTFGNALWAAWDQGITYDEFYHLEWPRRLLFERIDERESALRFDSKTPILLPSVLAMRALETLDVESDQALRFASRVTPIVYLALCLGLVAWLARPAGPRASWIAVLLVALDPNMAANASIATSDVAYALAALLIAWALQREGDGWASAVVIGGALGFAFAVKYTAVLLVPVVFGFVFWRERRRPLRLLGRLLIVAIAGCLSVSCLYLMVGVGAPLGALQFHTASLQKVADALGALPVPFPRSILTGIDLSKDHNDHLGWNCYIFGHIHPGAIRTCNQ